MSFLSVCILAGLLVCDGRAMPKPVDDEKAKLQGEWVVKTFDLGTQGLSLLERVAKGGMVIFRGEEMILKGDQETSMAYKLDPGANPKQLDLFLDKQAVKAIYKLEESTLTICIGDKTRPSEFKAIGGKNGQALIILSRKKGLPPQ